MSGATSNACTDPPQSDGSATDSGSGSEEPAHANAAGANEKHTSRRTTAHSHLVQAFAAHSSKSSRSAAGAATAAEAAWATATPSTYRLPQIAQPTEADHITLKDYMPCLHLPADAADAAAVSGSLEENPHPANFCSPISQGLCGVQLPVRSYEAKLCLSGSESYGSCVSGLLHGCGLSMDSALLHPFAELGSLRSTSKLHTGAAVHSDLSLSTAGLSSGDMAHNLPTRISSPASSGLNDCLVAANSGGVVQCSGQDAEPPLPSMNHSICQNVEPVQLQEQTAQS